MIKFKSGILSKKEKEEVGIIIDETEDYYKDFYITQNNERVFIDFNNLSLLYNYIKGGDKIVFSYEDGLMCVFGYSDKSDRKYIRALPKNTQSADKLLKVLFWNVKIELWSKMKKINPIVSVFKDNNFIFQGNRGRELLLCRKVRKQTL